MNNSRISLKEDLADFIDPSVAKEYLASLLTTEEKVFIETQKEEIEQARKAMTKAPRGEMWGDNSPWIEAHGKYLSIAERWVNLPNPRVRALLEPHFGTFTHELNIAVLVDLPLSLLPSWYSVHKIISRDIELSDSFLKSEELRVKLNIDFIEFFWGESEYKAICPIMLSGLVNVFIENEENHLVDRIKLATKVLETNILHNHMPNPDAARFALEEMKVKLMNEFKATNNLSDIPDSWIKEVLASG